MDSNSVVASALEMCSAVMNFRCLEMVLMKRILLINMMSPVGVISLYLSRMVIRMGKFSPLMCGFFYLGVFPFRHPIFPPKIPSATLTSSRFIGKFSI